MPVCAKCHVVFNYFFKFFFCRFLFEKLEDNEVARRILYTGDFRYESVPLSSLSALHDKDADDKSPLAIDEMYLDTTFCSEDYATFPPRQEACDRIWELVQEWVRKNGLYKKQKDKGKHVVLFHLPAQYGSERILRDIYEKSGLRWRVHTSDARFGDYLCSDELGDCTDSDPRVAQWIHACSWKDARSKKSVSKEASVSSFKAIPCQTGSFEVCHIRPSAMFFNRSRTQGQEDKVVKLVSEQYFRVCYSCHSSLQELKEFVKYFSPKRLVPCVQPPNSTMEQVLKHFEDVLPPSSLNHADSLGSLGSFTPDKGVLGDPTKGSPGLQNFFSSSPEEDANARKRKNPVSIDAQALDSKKRALLFDTAASSASPSANAHSGSSDEDDLLAGLKVASSRRKQFHRSKSAHAHASMPVAMTSSSVSGRDGKEKNSKSRRASLPYNLKIPAITITPSSPSPDPNHPDYPEFFEDKLYIESKNMSSASSTTESGGSGCRGDAAMDMDHQRLSQQVSSVEMLEEEGNKKEESSSSLEICYQSSPLAKGQQSEQQEVIELSSGGLAPEEEVMEEEESTPDLEEVLKAAATQEERENCDNFARGQAARRCHFDH